MDKTLIVYPASSILYLSASTSPENGAAQEEMPQRN